MLDNYVLYSHNQSTESESETLRSLDGEIFDLVENRASHFWKIPFEFWVLQIMMTKVIRLLSVIHFGRELETPLTNHTHTLNNVIFPLQIINCTERLTTCSMNAYFPFQKYDSIRCLSNSRNEDYLLWSNQ